MDLPVEGKAKHGCDGNQYKLDCSGCKDTIFLVIINYFYFIC